MSEFEPGPQISKEALQSQLRGLLSRLETLSEADIAAYMHADAIRLKQKMEFHRAEAERIESGLRAPDPLRGLLTTGGARRSWDLIAWHGEIANVIWDLIQFVNEN